MQFLTLVYSYIWIWSCVECRDNDPKQIHLLDRIASCVLSLSQFPQPVEEEVKSFDLH